MDGRASATRAGSSITRGPQPTAGSFGADMTRSIIGIMDLVLIWKTTPPPSHDWRNTSFSPFWGTTHHGRTAYAMGYTGLGVGASRFGARVILDLLDGCQTERTTLEMVRAKPLPFPPEPLRSLGIHLSRWSMAQADANEGRENLWLRAMNWLGLGFDS